MRLTTLLIPASFLPIPSHSHPIFLNTTDTLLHVREVTDPFHTAVCRGIKLSWAMQLPAPFASQFLSPIESVFDGDMRDALHHWGYTEIPVQGYLCDFDTTHHLDTAFFNLGIDPRSERRGGPNQCWHVEHQYKDHPAPVAQQGYWADGRRYRMTGAQLTIGINAPSGLVFFLSRQSAEKAAQRYWGLGTARPQSDELPALRSSSDIAWGLHNRVNWGRLDNIRGFMSMMVINADTVRIIERVLAMYNEGLPYGQQRVEEVQPWPGTTFDLNDIEGQALLGSPNGLAAGFILAQHKRQLGGDKIISKVTVFRSEQRDSLPNLLFWVA